MKREEKMSNEGASRRKDTHAGDHGEARIAVDDGTVTSIGVLVVVLGVEGLAKVGVELGEGASREGDVLRGVEGKPACAEGWYERAG